MVTTAIIIANPRSAPMIAPRHRALKGNPNPAPTIAQLAVYKHSIEPTRSGDLRPGGSYFAIGATTDRPTATIAVEIIKSLVENLGIGVGSYHAFCRIAAEHVLGYSESPEPSSSFGCIGSWNAQRVRCSAPKIK